MFFLLEDNCSLKKRKKVSFYTVVRVSLIPSINDFCSFKRELWWSKNDYVGFVKSSNFEVQEFVNKHPNMTITNAKKILYQPTYLYHEDFFEEFE